MRISWQREILMQPILVAFCKQMPTVAMVRYADVARSLSRVAGRTLGVSASDHPNIEELTKSAGHI